MQATRSPLFTIFLTVFVDMLGVGIIIPVLPALFFGPDATMFSADVTEATRNLLYGALLASFQADLKLFRHINEMVRLKVENARLKAVNAILQSQLNGEDIEYIDENGNGIPDGIAFDMSPQFFPSVSYDADDENGELDIIIADYSPPLAALDDSDHLRRVGFTAICQPVSEDGDTTRIDFSSEPAVSFSSPNGQPVSGRAAGASVLIIPQPDVTPQPTPTATFTATPVPSPTATPVPVPGNRPPSVGNDTATTNEDTSVTIDVLHNDSDPDGDQLTVDLAVLPVRGQATVNMDSTITYLPHADFNGNDSFTYVASDGRGAALVANVRMTVRAVNDPPVILVAPSDLVNRTGDMITLLISVNDVDTAQPDLTLTAEGLPSGIIVDKRARAAYRNDFRPCRRYICCRGNRFRWRIGRSCAVPMDNHRGCFDVSDLSTANSEIITIDFMSDSPHCTRAKQGATIQDTAKSAFDNPYNQPGLSTAI